MHKWDADQYLKFKQERTQPAVDLISRLVQEAPATVLDVGCGPGNSTQALSVRFPQADILGIDSSEAMITAAKAALPDLSFTLCDASTGLPALGRTFDLVFSNACLQWIPDHPALLRALFDILTPGGCLAVQIPINYEQPIHKIIASVAASEKWDAKLPNKREFYTLRPENYYDLLSGLTDDFHIWSTIYFHRMRSHQDIIEWYRGTGLKPYLSALSAEDGKAFEADIYAEVVKAYTPQQNGEIIFRFPRLFFTAKK